MQCLAEGKDDVVGLAEFICFGLQTQHGQAYSFMESSGGLYTKGPLVLEDILNRIFQKILVDPLHYLKGYLCLCH